MSQASEAIVRVLPFLRRYARALTGSQERGDRYVRVCVEVLIQEPERVSLEGDVRFQIFRIFHEVWGIFDDGAAASGGNTVDDQLRRRIAELPSLNRQVLLLTALEEFSLEEAAAIVGLSVEDAEEKLRAARQELQADTGARVLVIEDESVIALDIANIVQSSGHSVVGIAPTQRQAMELAVEHRPDLVLADIQLKDGDSGIVAVQEILNAMTVPVIFVTGFPERLLTGTKLEPAFVITKPFNPETLKIAIGQALTFNDQRKAAAV